jgi:hypothetical protein
MEQEINNILRYSLAIGNVDWSSPKNSRDRISPVAYSVFLASE